MVLQDSNLLRIRIVLRKFFADIDFELGIIAGNKPIDLISLRLINKPNDGKLTVQSLKEQKITFV
ncbi:hypothetical protein [Candidatus Mesenet endosymbiont of Agriotes lineatus]|uniref:hypothetical protein n=1 Tax=Candidatus Mesenet endosymbiont of Agriotes lineatus TaxID=3077948 RepID=UPI0030CC7E21